SSDGLVSSGKTHISNSGAALRFSHARDWLETNKSEDLPWHPSLKPALFTFWSPVWPAQFSVSPPLGSSLRTPCSRWSPKGDTSCPLTRFPLPFSALPPCGF